MSKKKKSELPEFKSPTIAAGGNAKTIKGDSVYQTAVMYLAPADASGMGNVCPMAVMAGCKAPCLFSAGRAEFTPSIIPARIKKTQRYFRSRSDFMVELVRDIGRFVRHCARIGVLPAVRLNGTSDIQWEIAHPCFRNMGTKRVPDMVRFESIFEAFPGVVFYDYTKIAKRVYRTLPANYSLTLSYSGANQAYADMVTKAALDTGTNMAVVFRTKALRDLHMQSRISFRGAVLDVINGDLTDMRFLDPKGCVVGLYAKGKAGRADRSGFVLDI